MSQHEDSPFDDDDYRQLMNDEGQTLTPEDVFSMVMINRKKKIKLNAELHDAEGNVIELHEVVEDLLKYIDRKMEEDDSQLGSQIFPLMSKIMASGLGRSIGIYMTGYYLANADTRYSFISMMTLAFLLLKYIQQKGLTIHTSEEPVDDDEIASIEQKSRENSEAVLGTMAADSSVTILKKMLDQGKITREQLEEILNGEKQD